MDSDADSIMSSPKIKQEEPDLQPVVSSKKTATKKDANRAKKRNLVRWDDDLDKRVLLTLQWACNERGLKIPWDLVAVTIGGGITEGAIVQHLAKLRNKMIKAEIPVPPSLRRGIVAKEPSKIYVNSNGKKLPPPVFGAPTTPEQSTPRKRAALGSQATPKSKPKSKGRGKRGMSDLDDSDQEVFDNYVQESDGDYGTAKKKARTTKTRGKVGKASTASTSKSYTKNLKNLKTRKVGLGAAAAEDINREILLTLDDAGPASRTRHVKQDFSHLEPDLTDEEEDEEDEEGVNDFEIPMMYSPTVVKRERSVSPRTVVPKSNLNVAEWSQGVPAGMLPPNSIPSVKGNDVIPTYQMAAKINGNGMITPSSSRNPSLTSLPPSLLQTPGPQNYGRDAEQGISHDSYMASAYSTQPFFTPVHYNGGGVQHSAIAPGVSDLGLGLVNDTFDVNANLPSNGLFDEYPVDDTFLNSFRFDS